MIPTRKVTSLRRPRGRATPKQRNATAAGFAEDSSSSSECPGASEIRPHPSTSTAVGTVDGLTGDYSRNKDVEHLPKRARTANPRVFVPAGSSNSFLEALKTQQLSRLENPSCGLDDIDVTKSGSRDQGDPSTTNLFIGQLHPETTERTLQLVFGRYGPIASIKIMWPRTAEEFARGHNSGFVSFMNREDAHAAFQNLHETAIDGHIVRLTWGRAQRRSLHPMPPLPGQKYGNSVKPFGTDFAIQRADPRLPTVLVQPPLDLIRRQDINRLARTVMERRENAQHYLSSVVAEEQAAGNSRFSFLWNPKELEGDDGVYYQWRLYSLEHNDSDRRWRTAPFAMFDGGPLWSPPPCLCPMNNPPMHAEQGHVVTTTGQSEGGVNSDTERNVRNTVGGNEELGGELGSLSKIVQELATLDEQLDEEDFHAFGSILHSLDTRRVSIGQAMVFCMDRSRCAGAVLAQIITSVVREPVEGDGRTRHLALLFLVSDILCNSGNTAVPRTSLYRMRLERVLPALFRVFGLWLKQIDGRMTAHKVASAAEAVLAHWTRISLFAADFTDALRSELFSGREDAGQVAQALRDLNPM